METLRGFLRASQAGTLDFVQMQAIVCQFQVSAEVTLFFLDLTSGFQFLHQEPLLAVAGVPLESSFEFESPHDDPIVGTLESLLQLRRLVFDKWDKHSI